MGFHCAYGKRYHAFQVRLEHFEADITARVSASSILRQAQQPPPSAAF
jgi:hypothetical protein